MEPRTKTLYLSFCREETAQNLVEYTITGCIIGFGALLILRYILGSSLSLVFLVLAQRLIDLF